MCLETIAIGVVFGLAIEDRKSERIEPVPFVSTNLRFCIQEDENRGVNPK
jgi:hypothetical protein